MLPHAARRTPHAARRPHAAPRWDVSLDSWLRPILAGAACRRIAAARSSSPGNRRGLGVVVRDPLLEIGLTEGGLLGLTVKLHPLHACKGLCHLGVVQDEGAVVVLHGMHRLLLLRLAEAPDAVLLA
eukprot:12137028-Alexandrium_andersonii.AAC.1